jgi:transposase
VSRLAALDAMRMFALGTRVVLADRGYDHDKYRLLLWAGGIKPIIARRGSEHGSGLGRERWIVERGCAYRTSAASPSAPNHS